ncbi:tyrosine-type recombinase/integrase [Streptomyces pseudogriseolus]|uniref:tyrosine-type recombinase/integrase n=1 Tax=Streptomyces pseudogriseolus TaxID=36817 RepID=UPI003FA2A68B
MIANTPRARDRFLIALLAGTGLRIGEALGLRQEDLHFLASSRSLGCPVQGPHLRVRRRTDNPNRAPAKSRHPRYLPVTPDIVAFCTDPARTEPGGRRGRDRHGVREPLPPPLGRAMTHPNAKNVLDRLARRAGHPARPHMPRHSAATRWLREGVDRDVVQKLLGGAWGKAPARSGHRRVLYWRASRKRQKPKLSSAMTFPRGMVAAPPRPARSWAWAMSPRALPLRGTCLSMYHSVVRPLRCWRATSRASSALRSMISRCPSGSKNAAARSLFHRYSSSAARESPAQAVR